MPRLSTWKICRSCAQRWQCSLRQQPRELCSLRQFSSAIPARKDPESDKVQINYYEQSGHSKESIRRISKADFDDNDVAEDIKARIKSLEEQLRIIESGKNLDQLSAEDRALVERVEAGEALSKEEMRKVLSGETAAKDAQALGISLDDLDMDDDEFDQMEMENMQFELPAQHQASLKKLIKFLREWSPEQADKSSKRLWQQYTSCKDQLPGFQEQLPKHAWGILWQSQLQLNTSDRTRSKNLGDLAEDIARAGHPQTPDQKMARIEKYEAEKKYNDAFKLWHEAREDLEGDNEVSEAFCDLGPSILSSLQRPSDAQSLALELSSDSPRVATFMPVFEAWLRQDSKNSSGKAWWLYLKVRELMKDRITPEDYDQLVMTFYKAGHTRFAIAIFKDLVVAGQRSDYDSLQLQQKSSEMLKALSEQAQDADSLNDITLNSLATLPRRFQNKFFYAMWMKRLIGLREIEAAASVLELMYLRGVRADPRHINGLISALLRRGRPADKQSGRPGDKELALETGWSMIRERINLVARRRALEAGQDPPPVPDDPSRHIPPYLGKNLPPATIETFSILLLYYSRSNIPSSVEQLHSALNDAEIKPNIYYLNHLLYMHLRRGNRSSLWTLFKSATEPSSNSTTALTPNLPQPPLSPDLSTFACLWDAEKAHIAANPATRKALSMEHGVHFPGPRSIFRRMAHWLSSLTSNQHADTMDQFSHDLYTQILRCFALARDLPATLVMLYAMRDLFGEYPNADDVRLVSIELARSSEPALGGWTRRRVGRFGDKKGSQAQLGRVAELLQIMDKERDEVLQAQGISKEELSSEQKGEEGLWLLAGLLRGVMQGMKDSGRLKTGTERGPQVEGGESLEDEIEKVAWGMGVGGLRIGAPVYKRIDGVIEMDGYEGQVLREAPEGEPWGSED